MNRAEYIAYFEAIRQATPDIFEKMVQDVAKYEPTIAKLLQVENSQQ
jgi:hypothetical protein|tara:strand:+ start:1229 stop:1369 length:141 start_codon:yes stop_codon:yes gene_type:complete